MWDRGRRRYNQFAAGVSTDSIPDAHLLPGTPRAAQGRFLEWNVLVSGTPGERYDVTIRLSADGKPLPDGVFRYTGQLAKPSELVADLVRLVSSE